MESARCPALSAAPNGLIHDGCRDAGKGARSRSGPGFHSRHRARRSGIGAAQDDRHALSAGAERLPAYRPRQVDLPQFRHRRRVRRPLQSALRRHQSDQGIPGIYRRHRARRALARLRLGHASLSRVGLFRAALRLGRGFDPRRQGLCRRSKPGRDARGARHLDGAGQEQPVPRPRRRGKSRSVPPHARRRISQRRPRAARQDRHGFRQYQSARPGALSHPARRASAHRQNLEHLSELRFRPRPVRRHRGHHPFAVHAGIRGSSAALRLVSAKPAGAVAAASIRIRPPQSDLYDPVETRAHRARSRRPCPRLGRSAHADACGLAAARRAA